ncbi:MAG: hypothetical protein ACQGVK_13200 [Myxococcota bacterium]
MFAFMWALLLPVLWGCGGTWSPLGEPERPADPPRSPAPIAASVHTAPAPSAQERFCAWFGDRRGGVLYTGLSAFWSELRRAGGDPRADLRRSGPALIGRFDLDIERWLEPIDVSGPDEPDPSGVWDVLAHPNGRIYFTTFFGSAGFVEADGGAVVRLPGAGPFLNELALGPDGHLLATRYSAPDERGSGSLVILDEDGGIVAEWRLRAGPGRRLAPKSVAYDPVWQEVWLTTDLLDERGEALPAGPDAPRGATRPALVVGLDGIERTRIETDEVQFVTFDAEGAGYLAVASGEGGRRLSLAVFPATDPARDLATAPRVLLDPAFPSRLDFVQEVRAGEDGRVLVARWSGHLHWVEALESGPGAVRTQRLPGPEDGGLFYTAVAHERRVCASYCADVSVVCAQAPPLLR